MGRKRAISLARSARDAVYQLLARGQYSRDDAIKTQAMLIGTIVDGLSAVIAILESNGECHADTIIRSMIEALGDLHHLVHDRLYLDRLLLVSARNVMSVAQEFIRDRIGDPNCQEAVKVARTRCLDAKGIIKALKHVHGVTTTQRVQAPGIPGEIVAVYAMLCFDAHGDIESLVRRHLRKDYLVCGKTLSDAEAIGSLFRSVLVVFAALGVAGSIGKFRQRDLGSVLNLTARTAASLLVGCQTATESPR